MAVAVKQVVRLLDHQAVKLGMQMTMGGSDPPARDLQAHGRVVDDQVDQRGVMPDGWRVDIAENDANVAAAISKGAMDMNR